MNKNLPAKTVKVVSTNWEQTWKLGFSLGQRSRNGDVFALVGELGVGKTVLTQGIAAGYGISERYVITSPTFTLVNEYEGERGLLFHMDFYRLAASVDLADIGAEEMFGAARGIAVVEWADRVAAAMPIEAIFIHISPCGESSRTLEIAATAAVMERLKLG